MDPRHEAVIRDRASSLPDFRDASRAIAGELTERVAAAAGRENVVCVLVLRAALVFLGPVLDAFPSSPVAIVGLRRDEKTAVASWYYDSIPPLDAGKTVLVFDPMLATGGSAVATVELLTARGADPAMIRFVCVIAAPEGMARLARRIPRDNILAGAVDEGLDARKFIVPGLGDFGDRFFGTT